MQLLAAYFWVIAIITVTRRACRPFVLVLRVIRIVIMKILMRADTHVSFSVPAEEPKAKCTNSQVHFLCDWYFIKMCKMWKILWTNVKFRFADFGSLISITRLDGRRFLISLHIARLGLNEGPQHHQLRSHRTNREYSVEFSQPQLPPHPPSFKQFFVSSFGRRRKIDFSLFLDLISFRVQQLCIGGSCD